MKIEVLYLPGCRAHASVVEMAREVIQELGLAAEIVEIPVRSQAEAERVRFLGSPSVRVDGIDIEPRAGSQTEYGLG